MSKRAFLDVDTQVDFVEPGGKLYAEGAEAIKPNLAKLVAHARTTRAPLISCVDAHGPTDQEFSEYPPHCLKGTPGQEKVTETVWGEEVFVANVEGETIPNPREVHLVLEKQQFSVFTSQHADAVFRRAEAQEFVVFGVVTEVCVKQAVEGLLERGYRVRVVTDAIWPLNAENGEATLKALEERGAVRTTTAEVLSEGSGES